MKNSTIFAICLALSAVWCMATAYGLIFNYLGATHWIEYIFFSIPFMSFVLCLIMHYIELRQELKNKL